MTITDRIYGSYRISEPVIIDLLASPPIKRLAHISQMGPPDKYYHIPNYSRLEHSIGVMLLLRHLRAGLDEQVAGLIHDVSHTAFSHVIDWVAGSGDTEDYQDNHHQQSLEQSEIKRILEKHSLPADRIISFKQYALLEQDIPHLCADRIDYALREFPAATAKECFTHLTVYKNRIIFNSKSSANLFAVSFLKRQMEHWGGYEAVTRYFYFAKVLRRALKLNRISWPDFMKDEDSITKVLESSNDTTIRHILSSLRDKNLGHLPRTGKKVRKKFRYVDPQYVENNALALLSRTDMVFRELLDQCRKENDKGLVVGTISV